MGKVLTIKWEQCTFGELCKQEDTYWYAVIEEDDLIYIGKSIAENGVYNEVHHNSTEFGWNREAIIIWLGYVQSYNGNITEEFVLDVENLLIYDNQPRDNDQGKKSYSGRENL